MYTGGADSEGEVTTSMTTVSHMEKIACLVEHGFGYKGVNLNSDGKPTQADWQSCRSFCKATYSSSTHFVYQKISAKCYCKTSKTGQVPEDGKINGVVTCSGQGK